MRPSFSDSAGVRWCRADRQVAQHGSGKLKDVLFALSVAGEVTAGHRLSHPQTDLPNLVPELAGPAAPLVAGYHLQGGHGCCMACAPRLPTADSPKSSHCSSARTQLKVVADTASQGSKPPSAGNLRLAIPVALAGCADTCHILVRLPRYSVCCCREAATHVWEGSLHAVSLPLCCALSLQEPPAWARHTTTAPVQPSCPSWASSARPSTSLLLQQGCSAILATL